jgi:hypothetical protein
MMIYNVSKTAVCLEYGMVVLAVIFFFHESFSAIFNILIDLEQINDPF